MNAVVSRFSVAAPKFQNSLTCEPNTNTRATPFSSSIVLGIRSRRKASSPFFFLGLCIRQYLIGIDIAGRVTGDSASKRYGKVHLSHIEVDRPTTVHAISCDVSFSFLVIDAPSETFLRPKILRHL